MDFRDELEAVLTARIEQSDALNRIDREIREGHQVDQRELLMLLAEVSRVHEDALLRVADEIDKLRRERQTD